MNTDTFCISTTTPTGITLVVNTVLGTTTVTDDQGYTLYATTTCAQTVTNSWVVTNPGQDMFNGFLLFFIVFVFFCWYFITRVNNKN